MIKITNISYSLKSTINMGNFENYSPEISADAVLEEGDNPIEAMKELKQYVKTQLWEEVKTFNALKDKKNNNR